jgi:hypothetical protein
MNRFVVLTLVKTQFEYTAVLLSEICLTPTTELVAIICGEYYINPS